MESHPRLTRPLHPLARPDGSVQLGIGPGAVVTTGVGAGEYRWLATLDGSRSLSRVVADAPAHGIAAVRARELVATFVRHGLVAEAPEHAVEGRVCVVGAGTVPAHLTEVLRETGSCQVVRALEAPTDEPSDVDLAVITSTVPVPAGAGESWRLAGVPVLPLWCGRDHGSVGPLLVPGDGPCLQCLELTRVAHDPGWPWIRAQISRPRVGPVVPVETHASTRSLLVGLAASVVLDTLGGRPVPAGWSLEASMPGPTLERRRWEQHPDCPRCGSGTVLPGIEEVDRSQWAG